MGKRNMNRSISDVSLIDTRPSRSPSRAHLIAISSKSRIGRLRRAIKRAFIVSNGQPLTTTAILQRAYPRFTRIPCGYRWGFRRALRQEAVAIARMRYGRGRPNLWVARDMHCDMLVKSLQRSGL
jgi:hypothetical protein